MNLHNHNCFQMIFISYTLKNWYVMVSRQIATIFLKSKKPSLEPVFSLSILGYCRNMADSWEEDLPLQQI